MKHALVFVDTRPSANSLAVLTGALEIDRRFVGLPIHFVRDGPRLWPRLEALAGEVERLVVGLSFATASTPQVSELMARLRAWGQKEAPGRLIIVAGGPHPSGNPEWTLEAGANVVVIGEGEHTFPELLARLFAGAPLADLPGLAYLANGQVVRTGRAPRVDLSLYPPFAIARHRFAPVEISRGCPHACAFCQTPHLFGGRMRHRPVPVVTHWVEAAMEAGYSYLRFITPDAFAYGSPDGRTPNLGAIEELLAAMNRLMKRELIYFGSFPSEVRPENVSAEALALVREYAANDNIVFGAQTGSPRLLAAMRREHTVEDVYRAVELTMAAGLTPIVDFIFGLPGETGDDRRLTLRMIEDLTGMGAVIHSHTFMPLPGTPLAGAPPGRVDPDLARLLDRLASEGAHIGQWRRQAAMGSAPG